jgi:hypothetical protein
MTQAAFDESVNREVRRLMRQGEAAAMTISNQKCICPNAQTRVESDPKCPHCAGGGKLQIVVTYERPPIPTTACNWSAVIDGHEEYGPVAYGRTKVEAVTNLLTRLEEDY